jgi:hypothetical protein
MALAPRVIAFGSARWLNSAFEAQHTGLGAVAGLRVAVVRQPMAAQLTGPHVRIISTDGTRREGRLLSLGATEVAIDQRGGTITIPLQKVARVEKATHRVRNGAVWGAIGGFVLGYLASCGGGDEHHCWPEAGALFAGIGAAAGAATGAFENRSNRERDVLYAAPASTASIDIRPSLSPRHARLDVAMRF